MRTRLSQIISLALLSLAVGPEAYAADAVDLGSVNVSAAAGAYRPKEAAKGTASAIAPTQSSLLATQPQSVITREFIEKSVAPTGDYSAIVNIAPSLSGTAANGPGLSETKTTMRGFKDDQYNITFDGIPWGDTNNPAHHSTSFFPASVIGGAVVERGPGNASNLGFATFGGTINLFSKKPAQEMGYGFTTSFGTWNTRLYSAYYESGRLQNAGDATVQLNYNHLQSDGYLTGNTIKSDNYTVKVQKPLGDATLLTAFASFNDIKYTQNDNGNGPTLAQSAQFGKNYSLNDDPTSFNYTGFNYTTKKTDFAYLRLQSSWGAGWNTDNSLYTYAYDNQTISSTDPTGATAPGTKIGGVGNKDIPGIDKQNKYRVYGDMFKATKQLDAGLARVGIWLEKSDSDRHQYDLDLTKGNIRDPRETKPTPLQQPSVLFDQQSSVTTAQPFAEFEWAAGPGLTVTPGVKFVNITRSVDALINQTTRLPQNASTSYRTTLPFLTINQQLTPALAVYAQYAKGFQIPDLKSFYIANPSQNSSDPQKSTNYQLGIVGKSDRFTWDADLYQIDFTNKYVSNNLTGADAAFVNLGGVTYKGIEAQGTYVIGSGFSVYANGSVNQAKSAETGQTIANAPQMTAALGGLYGAGPWSASLIYKVTGSAHQTEYDATKPADYDYYKVQAYKNADLGVSYSIRNPFLGSKLLKLQLNVFNLLDKQDITSITAGKTRPFDQYLYQVPRSMQISAKADF
ncbi:hypothetical protein GCM10022212_33230 [Actimicrobium antarcticum]|uniref:TonB-dependent receptor n=1 Tax=Actimicrobium antarcticum TaxID=1051899 RepID=A0ABP7TVB4_9BURK